MLCNVYEENAVEVSAAPWRTGPSQAVPARARQSGKDPAGELDRLRARIEELNALIEQREKEAWEQGRCAGDAAARKSLDGQVRTAIEGLAKTVAEVSSARAETIRRAENDTVKLAIEIARRVLHRELSIDTSALEALIRAALDKLRNQEVYRVRVHPEQEKIVRTCLEQDGRALVEVVSDPAQSRGGVSFEVSRGSLDASVDTQLREIENGLVDEMRRRA
ncbi:MAG: FliH/SctL family protein [Bryobacteraceae bacterium]|jgi:flagellar assembly protein FliH